MSGDLKERIEKTPGSIAGRVAAGAAWLDEKLPGWWKTHGIDLSTFNMAEDCLCVVGQLSPEKDYGKAIDRHWLDLTRRAAVDFGFYSRHAAAVPDIFDAIFDDTYPGDAVDNEYAALTREWRRVITDRRAAA